MTPESDSKGPEAGRTSTAPGRSRRVQEQLDEALEASFPASDPVSIVTSQMEEDWADPPAEGSGPRS